MKKIITFALIALVPLLRLSAQISEVEEIIRSGNYGYLHDSSIVRNYNDTLNVMMQYGNFENEAPHDMMVKSCSFMIQNTKTGAITHIVKLPQGYQVNDFRFVTLRKMDGVTTEDFCCFCGTRTQYDGTIALPNPGTGPTLYEDIFSKHGFAGFFSMKDALNPTNTCTAKIRDVEKTIELYRMTCYAETHGHYYHNNNGFLDNAVLDIIGTDDTLYRPSCFCRAKFYPEYQGSGVHWDNNIRVNMNEILMDVTKTDNYVVTTSHNISGNTQWIRYSGQEDHHIYGGLELNDYVNDIDFNSARIVMNCEDTVKIGYFNRVGNARICNATGNKIEIAFHMTNYGYGGVLDCRYDYVNNMLGFVQGSYLKSSPTIKDLVYMPSNNATAVLYNENETSDLVSVLTWKKDTNCNFPVRQFFLDSINAQSITLQKRNGYEHLLWSGGKTGSMFSNLFLMTQRGEQGNGYQTTCHKTNYQVAQPVMLNHSLYENHMRIGVRFPYDDVAYPVTYINFNPYEMEKVFQCEK